MSKKILAILLAIVVLFGVFAMSACEEEMPEEKETLTARQQDFVDAVDAIKTPITLDSGADIDAAYNAYAFLDEYERDSKTVSESKALLDGYQRDYTALKETSGGNQGGDKTDDGQEELMAMFIAAVNALPAVNELTLDDRTAINSAIALYNRLNTVSRENKDVISAYATLEKANNRVTALEGAANQEIWQRMAEEFISAVANLDEVTLDMGSLLEDLLYQYKNFPDGVKIIGGMAEAKAVLDAKYATYEGLRDKKDVQEFVSAVRAIGEVTLESEGAILMAENIYKYMSENARSKGAVIEAYETLTAARARYNELFAVAEAERIAHFIEVVSRIRTDLENVDITWYDSLSEARDAYFALSYESMQLPEVEEAFEIWDKAQSVFDKKGYEKIPDFSLKIVYSADTVPNIVMQLFEDSIANSATAGVRAFYGVSSNAELQKLAILYLDVYVDGVYVTKAEINMGRLVNGFILLGSDVLVILKDLSSSNPQIKSGANFSFAVHIEDRSGTRIPTAKTSVSDDSYNYTW